jgi:hypothetical protein
MLRAFLPRRSRRQDEPQRSLAGRKVKQKRFRDHLLLEPLEDRTLLSINPYTDFISKFDTVLLSSANSLQNDINSTLAAVQNIPFLDQSGVGQLAQAQVIKNFLSQFESALETIGSQPNVTDSQVAQYLVSNIPFIKSATVTSMTQPTESISFDLHIHQDSTTGDKVNFSFGPQGLPFKLDASQNAGVDIGVAFDYELKFGYDAVNGWSFPAAMLQSDPAHQLDLTTQLTLPSGFQLNAALGLLHGSLSDYVNVPNPFQPGQYYPNDPTAFGVTFSLAHATLNSDLSPDISTPSLGGTGVHVSLYLQASLTGATGNSSWVNSSFAFPSLSTHFVVDWAPFDGNQTTPNPSQLSVKFENVLLDLGTTLQSFAGPLTNVVQDILAPLQPVFQFLTTPVPGLSDLSHLLGGGDITFYNALSTAAQYIVGPELGPVLNLVGALLPVVEELGKISGGRWVPLGDFDLNTQQDQTGLLSPANFAALSDTNWQDVTQSLTTLVANNATLNGLTGPNGFLSQLGNDSLDSAISQAATDLENFLNPPPHISLSFPFLNGDPVNSLFNLFLGQDVTLFSLSGDFAVPAQGELGGSVFPGSFFGVSVGLNDALNVNGSFELAYDTYGLRELLNQVVTHSVTNISTIINDLLDGFYISDANTQLSFQGTFGPYISASPFPGVAIEATGGLQTSSDGNDPFTIKFEDDNQQTDGGKDRLTKLFNQSELFDATGEIDAAINLDFKLGFNSPLGFVGVQHSFDIAQATLVSYPAEVENPTESAETIGRDLGESDQNNNPSGLQLATNSSGMLVLNLSGVETYLQSKGQSTETFEIKDDPGAGTPAAGAENLVVSVDGLPQSQHFTGITSIYGDGTLIPFDQVVTVDSNVFVPAILLGGPQTNKLTYLGSGGARLVGGPGSAESSQLTGGSGPNMIECGGGNDVATGGSGMNTIHGGSGTDLLIGGPCTNGNFNSITAGTGDAQIYAGPSNDVLLGGSGNDTFNAGSGHDTMTGGSMTHVFNWTEGDGPLDVTGGPATNFLNVTGTQAGDQFVAGQDPTGNLIVQAGNPLGPVIKASTMQVLSLDGVAGSSTYQVNDLNQTTVQNVGVNLHEESLMDSGPDHVVVNAPLTQDNVSLYWDSNLAAQGMQVTQVSITPPQGKPGAGGSRSHPYQISLAIPKRSDTLHVNALGGSDTVSIHSTQPNIDVPQAGGTVLVDTGNGNNSITVGGSPSWLDHFLGPLNIDAGSGHNQITFDERGSFVGDIVTLTASQLIRYTQPPSVTIQQVGAGPITEIAYPLIINYKATGGDFGNGVFFDTSGGTTNLYLPETGANAPTTVTAYGIYNYTTQMPSHDNIYVGYDGAFPQNQSTTTIYGLLVLPRFPTTAAGSLLDALRSSLTVNGNGPTYLEVDDEIPLRPETYTVAIQSPPSLGYLQRGTVAPIYYQELNMTLNAADEPNTIFVPGVAQATTATINTGTGANTILVGDPISSSPALYILDFILGALTISGGGGTDDLAIHDDGNLPAYTYDLSAITLQRQGVVSIAPISFSQVTTTELYESRLADNTTNVTGTARGTTVTVYTGTGVDTVTVSMLDQLQGPLDLSWTTGTKHLVVDDTAATGPVVSTLGSGVFNRTGAATITFDPIAFFELFASLSQELIARLNDIPSSMTAKIIAGSGLTLVFAGSLANNLDPIQGPLSVTGGGNTTLYLEDQNSGKSRTYDFESGSVASASLGLIQFANLGLVLDASSVGGNTEVVNGTAASTEVTIHAGQNDFVPVGPAVSTLFDIQGTLDVATTAPGVNMELIDSSDTPFATYTVSATKEQSFLGISPLSAPIEYQGLHVITLIGSTNNDVYRVQSLPAQTRMNVHASGVSNSLVGPDADNTWQFQPGSQILDGSLYFQGVQTLKGGSGDDDFKFINTGFAGSIDGGSGTDTLDFSQLGAPVSVTLTQDGTIDGVNGTATALGGTFSNIESLIAYSPGSTLDGSSYSGNFAHTLTVAGFDTMKMHIAGDFSGSLLAATEGTAANPISYIEVAGSVAPGAKIKVNFLNHFLVGSNMAGLLKGFGNDPNTPTIQTIEIVNLFLLPGEMIAPRFGHIHFFHDLGGVVVETNNISADFQEIDIDGSLLASGSISAPSGGILNVAGDLAGTVNIAGALGSLYVGGKLTGSVSAASIGTLSAAAFQPSGGTLTIENSANVLSWDQVAGTVTILGSLNVTGDLTLTGGSLMFLPMCTSCSTPTGQIGGNVVIAGNASFTFTGPTSADVAGTVSLMDTATLTVGSGSMLGTTLYVQYGGASTVAGSLNVVSDLSCFGGSLLFSSPMCTSGCSTPTVQIGGNATVCGNASLALTSVSGGVTSGAIKGNLSLCDTATVTLSGTGCSLGVGGTVSIMGAALLAIDTGNTLSTQYLSQSGGTIRVDGTLNSTNVVNLAGGALGGRGVINGSVNNTDTEFSVPALNVGEKEAAYFTINGTYSQSGSGALEISIWGTTGFDHLIVTGAAALGGTLNVAFVSGFTPSVGSAFQIMSVASGKGTFSTVNKPGSLKIFYDPMDVTLTVPASPSMTTTPGGLVTVGTGARAIDAATLSNGFNETGTLTFMLYAPNGTTVVYTDVVTIGVNSGSVTGNGTYTTALGNNPDGWLPPATATPGVYGWAVSYSGDRFNNPAASPYQNSLRQIVEPEQVVGLSTGTPKGAGFWGNSNGQAVLSAHDPAWRTLLNSLNLRNGNGTLFTVSTTASFSTAYAAFKAWATATGSNTAYLLSRQLATMELNVAFEGVSASESLYIGTGAFINTSGADSVNPWWSNTGTTGLSSSNTVQANLDSGAATFNGLTAGETGTVGGFITIGQVEEDAINMLALYNNPAPGNPAQIFEQGLLIALAAGNNDLAIFAS